jgi:hypothetical protein
LDPASPICLVNHDLLNIASGLSAESEKVPRFCADTAKQQKGSSMPSPTIGLDEPVDFRTPMSRSLFFRYSAKIIERSPETIEPSAGKQQHTSFSAHVGCPWIFFDFPVHTSRTAAY